MKRLLIFFLFNFTFLYGQNITGVVKDDSGETLIGVLIEGSNGEKARSDLEGKFAIKATTFPITLTFKYFDFRAKTKTIESAPSKSLLITLIPITQQLEGIVVAASRRKQKIEDVTVSMEIISPKLIESKGLTDIKDAINLSPGLYVMEGQISIRGGSGFSYGAGSRVMMVYNDIPLLSADAGDVKFVSIPFENIAQIEILKGASSVLYGSGALNGVVSVRSKKPTTKGLTKLSYQIGLYDQPKRKSLRWTENSLLSQQFSIYNDKMFDNFGYTVSGYAYNTDGYRSGEAARRARISGSLIFKPKKIDRLKWGVDYNFAMEKKGVFIIWESDSLGYQPSGGTVNPYSDSSSLSQIETFRARIDPYAIYYDKFNNKHSLQTRFYNTTNHANGGNSASGNSYYTDYKFERNFSNDWVLTAGLTGNWGVIHSELYGNHQSRNYSIYAQIEKSVGKLDITAGVRGEYYQADNLTPDSRTYFSNDSSSYVPIRPIARAGVHYQIAKATHLRASFGQAYRYPSIAERFASTSVGALNIFPNPELRPERGWSAELGVKQGFKIGNFKGFLDVSGFINEYRNMMEFTFGYFKPESIPISFDPNDPGYIGKWLGFRAENAEHARIMGVELSINGTGKIGPVMVSALLGYTYMNPIVVDPDSTYIYGKDNNGGMSNPNSNMLKYRFNHLAKGDIMFQYKGIMLGFGGRYNSFMPNIDKSFESGVYVLVETVEILPGLKEYREKHNKGNLSFNARIGYEFNEHFKMQFIVNNIFNRENMSRPGDILPPRQIVLRLQTTF